MAEKGKIMSFVTETQIEELKTIRGERIEDGTATVDRPLFEILQDAKKKKDAEFNERFKNLPPKSLDSEEMEFLDAIDKQKLEMEKIAREEEKKALNDFQTALAERTVKIDESSLKKPQIGIVEKKEGKTVEKRKETLLPKVTVVPKKQKVSTSGKELLKKDEIGKKEVKQENEVKFEKKESGGLAGLLSYSDDEEEDE